MLQKIVKTVIKNATPVLTILLVIPVKTEQMVKISTDYSSINNVFVKITTFLQALYNVT